MRRKTKTMNTGDAKKLVKDFISEINGCEEGYKDKQNYSFLKKFSFDWLNIPRKCKENPCESLKNNYETLTGLDYKNFLEMEIDIYKGASSDPDSMDIVKCISWIIFQDVFNDEGFMNTYAGDTMNSFHSKYGYPNSGDNIWNFVGINDFQPKYQGEKLNQISQFYNIYHTIGNFIVSPKGKICGNSRNNNQNQYRAKLRQDDFGIFLELQEFIWSNGKLTDKELQKWLTERESGTKAEYWKSLYEENCSLFYSKFGTFDDYVEKLHLPRIKNYKAITDENYAEKASEIIDKRSDWMIKELFEKLNGC